MEDVELVGVGVIPEADCYLLPAVGKPTEIIHKFGSEKEKQLKSLLQTPPCEPIPEEWRMHAFTVDALPILKRT